MADGRQANTVGAERRQYVRYNMTGALPGPITSADGDEFEAIPVDVSHNGLGLLMDPGPKIGEILSLHLTLDGEPLTLTFQLRWFAANVETRHLPGVSSMSRCGLIILDAEPDFDLVQFLAAYDGLQIGE